MTVSENSRQVLIDRKISRIIETYSELYNVSLEEAADLYYNSVTAQLVEEGVADLHCRSDKYLAEELYLECHDITACQK
ncbi:MAG: DUF3791 domain-containing protein [Candidatus Cryptobacteroides sp.]